MGGPGPSATTDPILPNLSFCGTLLHPVAELGGDPSVTLRRPQLLAKGTEQGSEKETEKGLEKAVKGYWC